jgi:hypothetical protein
MGNRVACPCKSGILLVKLVAGAANKEDNMYKIVKLSIICTLLMCGAVHAQDVIIVEGGEATKASWMVNLLWPTISTSIIALIRMGIGKWKSKVPAPLYPIFNAVLSGILAAIAATSSPAYLTQNVTQAVLVALGFNKALDVGTGKANTVTAKDKRRLRVVE